jgi:hypothetical protein
VVEDEPEWEDTLGLVLHDLSDAAPVVEVLA